MLPPSDTDTGTPQERVDELKSGLDAINKLLGAEPTTRTVNGVTTVIPGGSLRVSSASARTVSMDQTFHPPIVLGYLGFDAPIYEGGELGPWIPTHSLLQGVVPRPMTGGRLVGELLDRARLLDQIESRSDAREVYIRAAEILGNDWRNIYVQLGEERRTSVTDRFADLALAYDNAGGGSIEARRARTNAALLQAIDEAERTGGVQDGE